MDITTIQELLRKGESEVVEAISNADDLERLQRTICGMANTKGGHIIVGVEERANPPTERDRFRYDGIALLRGLHRRIERRGAELVPPVKVDVEHVKTNKSQAIFVVGVPINESREMVSLKNGMTYRRKGSTTVEAEIFKPKTASANRKNGDKQDEIAVLQSILKIDDGQVVASDLAEITGLDVPQVGVYLGGFKSRGLVSETVHTIRGDVAEVTAKDRKRIAERIAELQTGSGKSRTEDEFGTPSAGLAPPESDASRSASELQADASNKLELEQQVDFEVVGSSSVSEQDDNAASAKVQDSESRSEASSPEIEVADEEPIPESSRLKSDPLTDREGNPIEGRSGQPVTASGALSAVPGNQAHIRREAKKPTLNAKEYGEVVAGLLATSPDSEAMTFALFGPWGRGKTFQMKQIVKALDRVEGGPTYKPVWFSAWKYRSTPETWAYLFQCLLQESRTDSLAIPWRAAFLKTGPGLALFAMFGLMVSLIPNGGTSGVGFQLVQLLGFGSVVYVVTVLLKFRSAGIRIARAYSPMDHSEKLGMQAAIGDDIRFLLQAWMPKPVESRSCGTVASAIGQWLVYLLLVLAVAWQLWRFETVESKLELPFIGELATHVHPYASLLPFSGWIVLAVGAPAVIFWPQSKDKPVRSLLIIDDLDRCDPSQMLDVIESTLLILDDSEIKCRLQVAILVDDFAFKQALSKKYDLLLSVKDDETGESKFGVPRLVRENQEKFFLLQLRLPMLQPKDIDPVVAALSDEMIEKQETGSGEVVIPDDAITTEDGSPIVVETEDGDSVLVTESEEEVAVDVVLHQHERDRLSKCIAQILEDNDSLTLGPRSINCILHRYQMGREILAKSGQEYSFHDLVEAIVREYAGLAIEEHGDPSPVIQVAKIVS